MILIKIESYHFKIKLNMKYFPTLTMIVFIRILVNVPVIQGIQDNMKNEEQLREASSMTPQSQTRLRRRRKLNGHHQYENIRYSTCANGEISFGISITTNANHGEISWSVESLNEEDVVYSNPLYTSHFTRSTYDDQLCLDESKCYTFKMYDTFGGDLRTLQQISSTTSYNVSLNNIIVFENPGHALTSFSFDFGQCQSLDTNMPTTNYIRSSNESRFSHPIESPTIPPTIETRENHTNMSKRCETEITIIVVLLLIVLVPRIGTLLCCIKSVWCVRRYMNSRREESKTDEEDITDTKSECTSSSSTCSGHDDKTILSELGEEEIDHIQNSRGLKSLLGNVSSIFSKG